MYTDMHTSLHPSAPRQSPFSLGEAVGKSTQATILKKERNRQTSKQKREKKKKCSISLYAVDSRVGGVNTEGTATCYVF